MKDIRRATVEDCEAIAALQRAAYAQNAIVLGATPIPLAADYAQILRDMECWTIDGNDGLDGALILEFRPADMLIWSVASHPSARSRGVGSDLLAFAQRRAREKGRDTIRLYTASVYDSNIAWYKRQGFAEESREPLSDRVKANMVKKLGAEEK